MSPCGAPTLAYSIAAGFYILLACVLCFGAGAAVVWWRMSALPHVRGYR